MAGDFNILHLRVIHQWLQAAQSEQRRHHGSLELGGIADRPACLALASQRLLVLEHVGLQQAAPQLALAGLIHRQRLIGLLHHGAANSGDQGVDLAPERRSVGGHVRLDVFAGRHPRL